MHLQNLTDVDLSGNVRNAFLHPPCLNPGLTLLARPIVWGITLWFPWQRKEGSVTANLHDQEGCIVGGFVLFLSVFLLLSTFVMCGSLTGWVLSACEA